MTGILAEIKRAGVERVVLLSSRSVVGGRPDNAIVKMWMVSETTVRSSGVSWTILEPPILVRAPFAEAPIAAIDPYDIAAVAAGALTSEGHQSRTYLLTGPEAIRPADQVKVLSGVLGRNLRFEAQPDAEARNEMSKSMPVETVDAFFRFFVEGEFDDSSVLPTVSQITGRQRRTFREWALAARSMFA